MSRPIVTPHTKHLEFDYPGTAGLDWPKSFNGPLESPAPSGLEFSIPEDEVADLGGEGFATPTPGSPDAQHGQTPQTGSIASNIKKRRRPEVSYDFGLVDQTCRPVLNVRSFDPRATLPTPPFENNFSGVAHTVYEPEHMMNGRHGRGVQYF